MKRFVLLVLFVCCFIMLSSCATILSDDVETVTIGSSPSGATVKIDGIERGVTPVAVTLRTDRSYTIELSKEGYVSQIAVLDKNVKWGWQLVDLLIWPFIGNAIDLLNPNGFSLSPDEVLLALPKEV